MDKKDGGNIDLESLRGFTPGPWHWVNGDTDEPYDLKAQWDGFGRPSLRTVRETTPPFAIYTLPEFILDAEPFDPRDEANARLIAAAPSMHAELTARRARDADVEALVAALREAMEWNWLDEDAPPSTVADQCEKALAPFTGDKT